MESNTVNEIFVERIFDAGVSLLWKAWTEPELIKLWFGSDPDGTVENVKMDVQPGGAFEITFSDSDLTQHTCRGTFLTIIEHKSLVYSWEWKSEPGHISEVAVSFQSLGEKTKIVLEHKNLDPASRHGYTDGWNGALTKIERILQIIKK
ncbi:MAG: SRPBCC domain-containing protein [Bacteroidota bacterium]